MARSVETIYSLIIAGKEAKTELDGLTSESGSAIFRLWAWVIAAVLFTAESMHDLFRSEIQALLLTLKPGTLLWYRAMIKEFQYGDILGWTDMQYGYATIDAAKMIVSQCSVTEGNRGLVVKVAREVSGELDPLSGEQEASLVAYIAVRKYAGTKISLVNSEANKLHVSATVHYNPLVIKADGTDITDATKPVELAIANYLRSLPFNGRLKRSSLINAILAVEGVADVQITLLQVKYGSGDYADVPVSYIPESGYFRIDTSHPLSTNLTYLADVQY